MTEKEKAEQGYLYDANYNKELSEERLRCKDLCFAFNQCKPSLVGEHEEYIRKILCNVGKDVEIIQPFWCDYGYRIRMGNHVFINHNCIILDCANVTFGNYVFIAPNCSFHTAGHPLDVKQRNLGLEYAYPITVEDNVWIGANVTVLAGVTIGKNSVIGAGSVVNKDIPSDVVAVGNPCKVIRKTTEIDKMKYKTLDV